VHKALQPQSALFILKRLGMAAVTAIWFIVVLRWWHYIDTYSVNLLVWDQWDLYDAFFKPHSWLELFRWQHGPHRQGIGFFLTGIIADLSGWNTRVEAFAIGAVVFGAMLGALVLKKRLTHTLNWTDLVIGLIFLTPLQYGIFAGIPNPSHGAVPLLLLMGQLEPARRNLREALDRAPESEKNKLRQKLERAF